MSNLKSNFFYDRGVTLVVTALAMSTLLGFMGLAIEPAIHLPLLPSTFTVTGQAVQRCLK